jgi:hypothetical protein
MDWGEPGRACNVGCPKVGADDELIFDPEASGPKWTGTHAWLASDSFDPSLGVATQYASLSESAIENAGALGLAPSAATALPSGALEPFVYGIDTCWVIGSGVGVQNGWDCDPGHWGSTLRVGAAYTLRDVDCYTPGTLDQNC